MRIAILGSGNVGGTLGKRWAKGRHGVVFGVRDINDVKHQPLLAEAGPSASLASTEQAAREADVVVVSTPWDATEEVIKRAGSLDGKVLIDATNPVIMGPNILQEGLVVGHRTSGAECVASWASGARVVKAFNTVGWPVMADPVMQGRSALMLICGDDPSAKATVKQLSDELGFDTRDAGELKVARLIEPFGMLWIHLAFAAGYGTNFGFQIIHQK